MKYIVEALPIYYKMGMVDSELNAVPIMGKQWEVSKKRLDVLLGNNIYRKCFVKNLGEKKPKKKTTED